MNPAAQAEATRALTREILDHGASPGSDGPCRGGTIFEWADGWWQDADGSPNTQEPGPSRPARDALKAAFTNP